MTEILRSRMPSCQLGSSLVVVRWTCSTNGSYQNSVSSNVTMSPATRRRFGGCEKGWIKMLYQGVSLKDIPVSFSVYIYTVFFYLYIYIYRTFGQLVHPFQDDGQLLISEDSLQMVVFTCFTASFSWRPMRNDIHVIHVYIYISKQESISFTTTRVTAVDHIDA